MTAFRLGANYWARRSGPWMWRRFDAAAIAAELAQARAMGLRVVRAFGFAPDFCPAPPAVDGEVIGRLRAFFDAATAADVGVIWSPLVGHMSGENFDLPGRQGRSLWTEPMLGWLEAWVDATVAAVAGSPALTAVSLSNEMTLWGGAVGAAEASAWTARLAAAVRRHSRVPVGTGDGMMSDFPTRATLASVDFVAPHVYASELDPLRQAYAVDFALRRAAGFGHPFSLEEFGASTAQAGDAEQAAYLREAALAAFGAGADAALWWCLSDFDLPDDAPYSHHPFEMGFGLLRADGSEKPAAAEARALAKLFDELPSRRQPATRVALLRPAFLDDDVPFSWQDKDAMSRTLLQAFTLAEQAGLDPVVLDEDAAFDESALQLILVPSTQKLLAPTWLRLENAARNGAVVYWSYHGGDHLFHRGPWCQRFSSLTGLAHRLRPGCVDLPPERFALRGQVPLDVPTRVATHAAPQSLARLPVEIVADAPVEVWGRDETGRPALTSHTIGAGRVVFLAAPLERYLAALPDGSTRGAHRLYRLLADEAGIELPYAAGHPDIQVRTLDEGRLIVVQHRGWTARVDDIVDVPRDAELLFDRGNADGGSFGPKGARVYRINRNNNDGS